MDRRSQRTRRAIYEAFSGLLARKKYSQITVQEILDAADIGRSTFYAHFSTKEDLLREICDELFGHIFYYAPPLREDAGGEDACPARAAGIFCSASRNIGSSSPPGTACGARCGSWAGWTRPSSKTTSVPALSRPCAGGSARASAQPPGTWPRSAPT